MYALSPLPKRTTPLTEPSSGQYSPVLACHKIWSRSFVISTIACEYLCGSTTGCPRAVCCGTGPLTRVCARVPPGQHLLPGGYIRGPHAFGRGQRHHGRFGAPEKKKGGAGGRGEAIAGEPALTTSLWNMPYADDAGVVAQSPEQLRRYPLLKIWPRPSISWWIAARYSFQTGPGSGDIVDVISTVPFQGLSQRLNAWSASRPCSWAYFKLCGSCINRPTTSPDSLQSHQAVNASQLTEHMLC